MKIVRKLTYLLLVLALVLSLAACGQGTKKEGDKKEPKVEEKKDGETKDDSKANDKEAKKEGVIAKIGLGSVTSLAKSKELKDGKGQAQADTTVVALAVDADGKIVDVIIDTAQSKAPVKDDGTFGFETTQELKTKRDLGDEYKMKGASSIKKEWFEQANGLEEAWRGKTVEEALNMKKDEKKDTLPELASSVTIKVSGYQNALKKASENLIDAKDAAKLGLGINTVFGHSTAPAKDDKGAKVQFETTMSAVATDKDGKVVASLIDTAQNTVQFEKDGKLSAKFNPEGTTKKELGEKYGMKGDSGIKKEWNEQITALEKYLVGKTADDVKMIELKDGKATNADLVSSVTVKIGEYQKVVSEALQSAR